MTLVKETEQDTTTKVTERVRLNDHLTAIADSNGRFWTYRPPIFDVAGIGSTQLLPVSKADMTQGLMDAALVAGCAKTAGAVEPKMTLIRNIWGLLCAWQTTHATPQVLRIAGEYFTKSGRPELAEYAYHELKEEIGHDDIVLKDLESLGLPAKELVTKVVAPTVQLADLYKEFVHSENPTAIFGYAYVLERLMSMRGQDYIDSIAAVTPPGVQANRTWIIHSGVGSDARHVREMVEFVAELPAVDRETIVKSTYRTALVQAALPWQMTDDDINEYLIERGVNLKELAPHLF